MLPFYQTNNNLKRTGLRIYTSNGDIIEVKFEFTEGVCGGA